jgi:hypothetical protein
MVDSAPRRSATADQKALLRALLEREIRIAPNASRKRLLEQELRELLGGPREKVDARHV